MRRLLVGLLVGALLLATAPAVLAKSGPPTPASGVWSWVNTGWTDGMTVGTCPACIMFATGSEASTWTGTFTGTSTDTFKVVMSGSGAMWATLSISFVGSVNGADGTLRMFATAWAPPDANMTGTWVILGGTGGLSGATGHGSWTYTGDGEQNNSADYFGRVQVPHH